MSPECRRASSALDRAEWWDQTPEALTSPLGKPYLRRVPAPAYRSFSATVAAVNKLTPGFVLVTYAGEELAEFGDACLDQRIKIVFPHDETDDFSGFPAGTDWYAQWRDLPEGERHDFRTYTPRAVRREAGEVDVIFAVHGDGGPASRWAAQAAPGMRCVMIGPNAESPEANTVGLEWKPGRATDFLIVGDETAVPAIWSICAALPADATGEVLLEVPTAQDTLPIEVPSGVNLRWFRRDGRGHGEAVQAAVSELEGGRAATEQGPLGAGAELGDGPLWQADTVDDSDRFAWVAGEASMVVGVRRALVNQHGWSKKSIVFMGYWRQGRSEV